MKGRANILVACVIVALLAAVAVPESTMRTILQRVRPGCAILIDTPAACMGY